MCIVRDVSVLLHRVGHMVMYGIGHGELLGVWEDIPAEMAQVLLRISGDVVRSSRRDK